MKAQIKNNIMIAKRVLKTGLTIGKILAIAFVLTIVELIAFANICYSVDLKQAKKYSEQGEYSKSISLYLDLIERDTNNSETYISCADTYMAAGDYQAALELLNGAVEKGADESIITQKINETQWIETSNSVELTDDYETFVDKSIFPFMFILIVTICIIPTVFIVYKVLQSKRELQSIIERRERNICANTDDFDSMLQTSEKNEINIGTDADLMLQEAIKVVVENGFASTGLLQQKLKLSYARAARIVDEMEQRGIVGPYEGSNPRKVLVDKESLYKCYIENNANFVIPKEISKTELQIKTPTLQDILNRVDAMNKNGWEFEEFTAELLLKNGFESAKVTSGSNDYGVDVLARDKNGISYAIQCKCYSQKLNNSPVQEVAAGMVKYHCQVGVVFTNNFFTDNAIELAKANNILLWDRTKLIDFIKNTIE